MTHQLPFSAHSFIQKAFTTLLFSFLCYTGFAQDTIKTSAREADLLELKGFTPTIYYSAGQLERAGNIAAFTEGAITYFREEIAFTPKTILYILSPQNWKQVAAKPLLEVYGFPHNIDQVRLAIAAEDNDFFRSFLPAIEKLPAALASEVKKAYGKEDGTYSMMPFFDLLAIHEMGHSYTSQAGLKMHRRWMGELFVNIMLHTYVAEKQPGLLPALETFPDMIVGAGTAEYKYTSLEDFERLYASMGMGPKNYGWYQCKLHSAAKDIYNAAGKAVLKRLWKALKEHQEEMTNSEFAEMLKKEVDPAVANVYLFWNKTD